ncbi:MAG TPA: APC family permease [bacterium]|jgi:APA family basic amino acid/polyamine antiporter|nr:APC family permease [bacterium]
MASRLERQLGVAETTSVAVGAMIGAGVYVSMGEAAGTTGGSLLVAVLIGAAVALLNGLSSAELAVDDPQAGGAYLFASRLISPPVGFAAGWLFLFAGLTAGATFSLTFAAYLGPLFPSLPPRVLGIALTVGGGLLNALGVRPSIRGNIILVLINGAVLLAFIGLTLPLFEARNLQPFLTGGTRGLAQASALLFFAYTGYARPVTIAEEVKDPSGTLPRAVAGAIAVVTLLYFGVAVAALGALGAQEFGDADAPLRVAVTSRGGAAMLMISIGALIATSTVLLTEIWGLSRLTFAMARQGDLPRWLARLDDQKRIPRNAILVSGGLLVLLAALLDLRPALEASSLALLVYYALMNLSALRLPRDRRLYPAAVSAAGLAATVILALTMPVRTLLTLLVVIAVGMGVYTLRKRLITP